MKANRIFISSPVEYLRAPTNMHVNGTTLSPKVEEARGHNRDYSSITVLTRQRHTHLVKFDQTLGSIEQLTVYK